MSVFDNRFRASKRVEHGCCYAASVEDLTKPQDYEDEHGRWFNLICECYSLEDAQYIAEALNRYFITCGKP